MLQPLVDLDPVVSRFPWARRCVEGMLDRVAQGVAGPTRSGDRWWTVAAGLAAALAVGCALLIHAATWWSELRLSLTVGAAFVAGPLAYVWFLRAGPAGMPGRLFAFVVTATLLYAIATADQTLALLSALLGSLGVPDGLVAAIPGSGDVPNGVLIVLVLVNLLTFAYWWLAKR